jgi:hypothetical protein
MKDLSRFLKQNSIGVAAPLLLISSLIAGDLNFPGFVGFALRALGVVALFIHFFTAVGPWFSKRISYGEALVRGIGPVMLVWVVAVLLRGIILGILGKPL